MQPFTVAAIAAAAVTAPYQTPQAVDTEAPCKGEIPGVQTAGLCEGCISLSNAEHGRDYVQGGKEESERA